MLAEMMALAMQSTSDTRPAVARAQRERDPKELSARQRKRQEKLARRAERARRDAAAKEPRHE